VGVNIQDIMPFDEPNSPKKEDCGLLRIEEQEEEPPALEKKA